jgi:Kae1-associated kinase Bud32
MKQLINSKPHLNNENNKDTQVKLLAQAAEAKIYKEGNNIVKDRISKGYRHPLLDKKIIKQRTRREASILEKAHKLINSPLPEQVTENQIKMPFIDGKKLSDNLEQLNWKEICKQIGKNIALLHDNDIIHGDLTTSNMILVENTENPLIKNKTQTKTKQDEIRINETNPRVIFIDFGLSFHSKRFEDKAVDLHLIKQALEAKHFSIHREAEQIILENYNSKDKTKTLEQLKKVEARGRYKH